MTKIEKVVGTMVAVAEGINQTVKLMNETVNTANDMFTTMGNMAEDFGSSVNNFCNKYQIFLIV